MKRNRLVSPTLAYLSLTAAIGGAALEEVWRARISQALGRSWKGLPVKCWDENRVLEMLLS